MFDYLMNNASIVITVISLATFVGILVWVYALHRNADFDAAARIPFDDDNVMPAQDKGQQHV
jgi:cbb3-type cytochrome oxidase subunit 3